jgi:hypothetical protein
MSLKTAGFLAAGLLAALAGCRGGQGTAAPRDSLVVIPATPLEVAVQFSNLLSMNDPACFDLLEPSFRDSVSALTLPPWQVFGRWRGFDASGRLTEVIEDSTGSRTSYFCTISRMEGPAITRIDFALSGEGWLIEAFGEEIPEAVIDSLTVERTARMIMANPQIRFEMRLARELCDDCCVDSILCFSSLAAAQAHGTGFAEYVSALSPEGYALLALSNIRRSAKLQIVQDRATFNIQNVPAELNGFVASWREMAYLGKAVLRARHEAMQTLRLNGSWMDPDSGLDLERLAVLRSSFLAVSDLVEQMDTLGGTWPALLTTGTEEPLQELLIQLDPHMTEQRSENESGITVWRALGVEMNGDQDPERVVYWAGNLYLFQGTPTGYRLVWRTFEGFESDYHADFASQPSTLAGCRDVTFIGNGGEYEYRLTYEGGGPVLERMQLASSGAGEE